MSDLLAPLTLPCGLELPNRAVLAPLTNLQSHSDGALGDDEYTWLLRRATGGFGWVSTCAAHVSEQGHAWDGQLGIHSDACLPGLTRLAAGLRGAGAPSLVQLHHGGVQAKLADDPISTGGPEGARAATEAELQQVTADYVAAALRAERAGFDGVEVHGANGYLFTQFLAPADNPRTDRYGGDLGGRALLLRETLRAVRAAVAPGFAVGVRISPVDSWSRRGLVLADSLRVGRWLAEDGADFVHLSLGTAAGPPPFEADEGPVAAAFRAALPPEVAVVAAGGIWTREDAQAALDCGADLVALGRAAIGNPDWPRRCGAEGGAPVRPPFAPEHLRGAAVGEAFLSYLSRFAGLVAGGAPARE